MIWPLTQLEQLDQRTGRFLWEFIQRDGRPSLRRLLWLSLLCVFLVEVPCIVLLTSLIPGQWLGIEQAAMIGTMLLAVPSPVLLGGLFAARIHGVFGRRRSIPLAVGYAMAFLGLMLLATHWIVFPSVLIKTLYVAIATGFWLVASYALGKKCLEHRR